MTTSEIRPDQQTHDRVIVLANNSARRKKLERALSSVAGLRKPTVKSAPVKRGFQSTMPTATLAVLDADDGHIDPLYWIKQIHISYPGAALMLIASTNDPLLASRALRAGAAAFILGKYFPQQLDAAIARIAEGERYVSEEVMQGILHGIVHTGSDEGEIPVESLSDREMMVFQLLGEGKIVRTIADELGVNVKTVATHCNNIRRKLHTTDNRELSLLSRDWVAGRNATESPSRPASSQRECHL